LEELQEFNFELDTLFDQYISFIHSYLSVHRIFKPFIDEFLHSKETYLTPAELAKAFDDFNKSHGMNFQKIQCRMNSFRYKSLVDSSGNSIVNEFAFPQNLCYTSNKLVFDDFMGFRHQFRRNFSIAST